MATTERFPVEKSDEQWRQALTPEQYAVLRGHATEVPGSCALLQEHRAGTFSCAGCARPLFATGRKFESGTGWPSFFEPTEGAVGTTVDRSFGMARTEVHCSWLRRASRSRLRGRSAAHGTALLHQRRRPDLRADDPRAVSLVLCALCLDIISVSRLRDSWRKFRSAAPGWQGATTENIGHIRWKSNAVGQDAPHRSHVTNHGDETLGSQETICG